MAKKSFKLVKASAALAVTAAALTPVMAAEASTAKAVELKAEVVLGGKFKEALALNTPAGVQITWGKHLVTAINKWQTVTGKGSDGKTYIKKLYARNYPLYVLDQDLGEVEAGSELEKPSIRVMYRDGKVYTQAPERFTMSSNYNTKDEGKQEVLISYNHNGNRITKMLSYTVKNTKVEVGEFKAVAADALQVEFNKEVDFSKAKFELKRGTVAVNATVVPSADKKSAKLELPSKLFEGDYTLTVSGLTEAPVTKTVKVENEKVGAITFSSTTAPVASNKLSAKVNYKVANQYGEDITSSPLAASIQWTASNGVTAEDDNKGVLTLSSAAELKKGDLIAVTGINVSTNTVLSQAITIADVAVADSLTFSNIFHKDGKELAGSTPGAEFALLLNGVDQYGKALTETEVNEGFIFTSSNPAVLNVNGVVAGLGADKKQTGLRFTEGANYAKGGTVIITAISRSTGKVAQYQVNVKAAPAVAKFDISAPAELVAANETVAVPFVAVDQFGAQVTKFDDLNGKVSFSSNKLNLVKGKDGVAVLEYTAGAAGFDVQVATVPASGHVSQFQVDVKAAAYAATIESLKDVKTTLAVGGEEVITYENIVAKDQYGRTFDLKGKLASGGLSVQVTEADAVAGAVSVAGTLTSNSTSITLSGVAKGSEDVTFSLYNGSEVVATSPLKVNFTTVDKSAYNSFEVAEVGTLYADGPENTHTQDLKVYGVKADGSKVLLPASYYTVITDSKVAHDAAGKLNSVLAAGADVFTNSSSTTSTVTIVVDGEKTPVTLTKVVTISNVAPKANVVEFKKDTVVDGVAKFTVTDLETDNDAAKLSSILKVTDQYGVAIDSVEPTLTVTNLVDNSGETNKLAVESNGTKVVDITGADVKDTFIVTYLLDGKTVTVKGLVVADSAQ
jgi:hypothetical protein